MDPKSADELYDAFIEFENSKDAFVAVFGEKEVPFVQDGT